MVFLTTNFKEKNEKAYKTNYAKEPTYRRC